MNPSSDWVTIADCADVNPGVSLNGLTPKSQVSFIPMADVAEGGGWIGHQTRNLVEVRVGYTPFIEGDILFAKITPCMENGKGAHVTGLLNGVGFGSTEFHVLRARHGNNARFLYHWLQAKPLRQRAIAFMGGSAGQQRVQADFFRHFQVPKIEPAEQSRIAAVLDAIDAAIEKADAVIAKLKQVRAGVLHDLLTRGLDDNGEIRDPIKHPNRFRDSPIGTIPSAWDCKLLLETTTWFSGGTPDRSQVAWWTGSVPFLSPKDMKVFEISDTIEHVTDLAARSGSRLMPPETVFIVVRGMILAHTFPVCLSTRPFAFNQDVKAIRGGSALTTRFLAHWFAGNANLFLRKATAATHGTKKLDMSEINRVMIACPSLDEQKHLVERIELADNLIAEHESELNILQQLKSGLMSDLLTGRVPVPETIVREAIP